MMKNYRSSNYVVKTMNSSLWDLPTPSNLSYFWNFGSMLGICLSVQLITGFILSLHYTSFSDQSFSSVLFIMRDVWSGWLVRLIHMNGASMFFFFIYLHMARGLYYGSFMNKGLWFSGVLMMIAMMAISFLGYVLPWGQMSYWAVAVITNLFSVIPLVGNDVVHWIWGGFSVGSPTLTRFYSLHFILPFILTAMVILHLYLLHNSGSSNSMGTQSNLDKIPFHPFFTVKDFFFIICALLFFILVVLTEPYYLGDPVNMIPANPMQTPEHIQPEWYFLVSYAILRAYPTKVSGVLALAFSVTMFFLLPLYKIGFAPKFSWVRSMMFWFMLSSFLFLMKMGSLPAEEPYIMMAKNIAWFYFSIFLIMNL